MHGRYTQVLQILQLADEISGGSAGEGDDKDALRFSILLNKAGYTADERCCLQGPWSR